METMQAEARERSAAAMMRVPDQRTAREAMAMAMARQPQQERVQEDVRDAIDVQPADGSPARFANGSSTRDALGALPSTSMFRRRLDGVLADAVARRLPLAVLVLELGDTPECADEGSPRAHALLTTIAARLGRLLRGTALLHRNGPTSFTCVLTDIPLATEFQLRVTELAAALAAPIEVDGRECTVRARIGVATCPADGLTGEVLRKRAAAAAASLRVSGAGGALADIAYFSAQGD